MSESWGGSWTHEKLEAFSFYVDAYLKIMLNQKKKYNGWPTLFYFDGFAGSGTNQKIVSDENKLLNFTDEELSIYKGSAQRVLSLERKFDKYYFVDISKENLDNLKSSLKENNLFTESYEFIEHDVNCELKKFVKELTSQSAGLVFLDPFGMNIRWESIELFKDKRVDLWILIPSGVAINRLLTKKENLIHFEKLETFFGMPQEEIKDYFYKQEHTETLFGTEKTTIKVEKSIEKVAELYVKRLKNVFKEVTKKPLKLTNSKNVTIYHLIFASNNKTACKIASQIIEKKNK